MSCDIFNDDDRDDIPDWVEFKLASKNNSREGVKHDNGKARYDLFPWELMDGVITVYTHGAFEYGDNNWRAGFVWGRIIGAIFRHLTAWITGNDIDPKTGLHNLDQVVWNALTLRWMQKYGRGTDDRYKL